MIYIDEEFATRKDAEEFMIAYLNQYNPWGYGTRLAIREENNKFFVRGSRWHCCD